MRETPSFHVGCYLFADKLLSTTTAKPSTSALASNTFNKLLRQTVEPYFILEVRTSTVSRDEYEISNTASIDRGTRAPSPQANSCHHEKLPKANQASNVNTYKAKLAKSTHSTHTTDTKEYTGDKTVRYIGHRPYARYIVSWYRWRLAKCTFERADHIPPLDQQISAKNTQTEIVLYCFIFTYYKQILNKKIPPYCFLVLPVSVPSSDA